MSKIRFAPEAAQDLQGAKDYITNELCNRQAANNTVARIMQQIRRLSDFPQMGAPLSSIIDFDTNYRYLVYGNYIVFYRFEKDEVFIIRVLYGRRNYMQALFGELVEE